MNPALVAYDIACDRRRSRVQKIVDGHGWRLQQSVGLVAMDLGAFRLAVAAVAETEDLLLTMPLCPNCAVAFEGPPLEWPPESFGVVIA